MIVHILFLLQYALVTLFGILLSISFAGIKFNKKTILITIIAFCCCNIFQGICYCILGEDMTFKLYPVIVHTPLLLLICLIFKKRLLTGIASITTAYLMCQPAKWLSMLVSVMTGIPYISHLTYIIVLIISSIIFIVYLSPYITQIYNKDSHIIAIFSSTPVIYYLFDYTVGIYSNLWVNNSRLIGEFVPFVMCIVFTIFCVVYYKEYEKRLDTERKELIMKLTIEQQSKEIKTIKDSNMKIRILRHDMRFLLNNIAFSIENNDKEASLRMLYQYLNEIDTTSLHRYCENDIVNYILSIFENKCNNIHAEFITDIQLKALKLDETILASIISNALDNALNAQQALPENQRQINFLLKESGGKLLLSVKNPVSKETAFEDGMPLSDHPDHGYGTQSIRYMTERLGGNYQFSVQNGFFITRIVI